jgi:hypothetical protein
MAIHIICPAGGHGGVITGRIDTPIPPESTIEIEQFVDEHWMPRRLETGEPVSIPAARLWSCNLGYQPVTTTHWRAHLVVAQVDRGLVSTPVPASPLSITHVPGDDGGKLRGTLEVSARWHSGVVLPFFWHSTPLDVAALSGWIPLGHLVETDAHGSWETDMTAAVQYAVLHVPDDFYQTYKGRAHLPLGTLPVKGVLAAAFASTIDIVPLTKPDRPFTGAVTGLGCVYNQSAPLRDALPPLLHERLWVTAWAIESGKPPRIIESIPCEPNGQWSFGSLQPSVVRTATTFRVALTMAGYAPSEIIPEPGGDVIAVTPDT